MDNAQDQIRYVDKIGEKLIESITVTLDRQAVESSDGKSNKIPILNSKSYKKCGTH